MSLILAMALRLVPRFKAQAIVISNAQRCIGRDISCGNIFTRARNGMKIISILVTWALENAIDTADSMKSRGYGMPGRTAFSIYHFDKRDALITLLLLACGAYIVTGAMLGGLRFRYFPMVTGVVSGVFAYSLFAAYFVLCIAPVVINIWEDSRWKAI
jgi:energy-coupling factor transport system permease protein